MDIVEIEGKIKSIVIIDQFYNYFYTDKYHNIESIFSVSAIDYEVETINKMIQQSSKGDKSVNEYLKDKIESLEFTKQTIEDQIGSGLMTPQLYLKKI